MKAPYTDFGYMTYDLSECKVHQIVSKDGSVRLVLLRPTAWKERGDPVELDTVLGDRVRVQQYVVTDWEELELQIKGTS